MGHHDPTPGWLAGLLEKHGAALVLYARQWCTCPEDIVQDAFAKLVSRPARPEHVAAWLYRVVRNGADERGPGRTSSPAARATHRGFGGVVFGRSRRARCPGSVGGARGFAGRVARGGSGPNLGRSDVRRNRRVDRNVDQHGPAPLRTGTARTTNAIGEAMRDSSPLDAELNAFEQQLAALSPRARLDRDGLMFAAGMRAGRRRSRRAGARGRGEHDVRRIAGRAGHRLATAG